MKDEMDALLKHVLTPREEAGDTLNRQILEMIKEDGNMRQKKYRRISAAAVAAALVAATSVTAVAAWQYRSAADVADKIGDDKLSDYFVEQMTDPAGKAEFAATDGITGESQSYGGYRVTVLGMLSGEGLSEFQHMSDGEVKSDRTYCAVAIQREDGAQIDAEHEEFFVSPLIGGLKPWFYNIASMHGNYNEFVEGGVLYRLLECENIEYFADHDLYLCVTDTTFYDNNLYFYDEADGSISRNTEYQGLNALFDLEMDRSLADPVKAQALIDEIEHPTDASTDRDSTLDTDGEPAMPEEIAEAMAWAATLTPENIEQYCVRMENTVQTLAVDENGYFVWGPWLVNEEVSDTRGGGGGKAKASYLQDNIEQGMWIDSYGGGSMEDLVITTFTPNVDGTLTFAAWVPKEVSKYLP